MYRFVLLTLFAACNQNPTATAQCETLAQLMCDGQRSCAGAAVGDQCDALMRDACLRNQTELSPSMEHVCVLAFTERTCIDGEPVFAAHSTAVFCVGVVASWREQD